MDEKTSCDGGLRLVDSVEMAEAVMGGEDALRRHPILTCYINVVSGLNHNAEALQKLLYLSGKGLPSIYIPSTTAGTTRPIMWRLLHSVPLDPYC